VLEVIIAQLVTALFIIYFIDRRLQAVIDYLHSIESRVLLVQAELKSLSKKVEG
jgi:hypothetical protein